MTTTGDYSRFTKMLVTRAAHRRHKYAVGTRVSFRPPRMTVSQVQRAQVSGATFYVISRQLPDEGEGFQYRIRNIASGTERMVVEEELDSDFSD